ncbi:MAG: membrane-bound O-acyltransferase family protein [Leptospiraceae bacterium]|nr:MAG: membrane-bound O-acyltransferase family protein [Leptospiraceae bacterium]
MIFNSNVYLYFFIIVICIYWLLLFTNAKLRYQNLFLLLASYFFYGWWDWLYLSLIFISTFLDYFISNLLDKTESEKKRKLLLSISVIGNLAILFTFKYYNFFINNFIEILNVLYQFTKLDIFLYDKNKILLNVLLPVGISFYTFQTMSYTIDVYRKIIKPEKDFLNFSLFVCFFPQLVAGPIERAQDLLPQINQKRKLTLEHIIKGIWYLLYGYYLKVGVADHLSEHVNKVFLENVHMYLSNPQLAMGNGSGHILIGGMAFAFQVYCDFAGYSNIAKGSAKFLGFELSENFHCPEFSKNPVELYNRWHITLNRWFTDYIYIPLGGNRLGELYQYRNILIVFFISGVWHGANWTFINWGILNGIYAVFYIFYRKHIKEQITYISNRFLILPEGFKTFLSIFITFLLFGFAAISFRAYNFDHSMILFKDVFTNFVIYTPGKLTPDLFTYSFDILRIILPVLILDYFRWKKDDPEWIFKTPFWVQLVNCIFIIILYYYNQWSVWKRCYLLRILKNYYFVL